LVDAPVAVLSRWRGGSVTALPIVAAEGEARRVIDFQMAASLFLIGAALALAGIVGAVQPSGHRGSVLLALLAGAGVGIAGLALGWSSFARGSEEEVWRVFFSSSIAGFVTVAATLVLVWRRARPHTGVRPENGSSPTPSIRVR
jgi:hypothetical protein